MYYEVRALGEQTDRDRQQQTDGQRNTHIRQTHTDSNRQMDRWTEKHTYQTDQ